MKVLIILPAGDLYRITKAKPKVPKRKLLRFSILPLLIVASLTPSEYEVDICDENVEPFDTDNDADIIGISFMTTLVPRAFEIAKQMKDKGKTVIAGGYYPTLCPEETSKYFDSVIVGDAENLWQKALDDLQKNELKKIYRHKEFLKPKKIPVPKRELLTKTSKYYATINAVQTGRGCIHQCKYCSITAFYNGKYEARPIDEVIQELKDISGDFIFVDDNIVSNADYAKELFSRMIGLNKRWVSQCSLKIADDDELLLLAQKAGCIGLFIGIETLNYNNLCKVGKGINTEYDLLTRVRKIHRAGIGIVAGIIVGMDEDTVDVFETMLNFLQKSNIGIIQVNIMTPLPGTPLYNEMDHSGRIIDNDLRHYDFRHVVIQPAQMRPDELQNGADWLYNQFYRLDRIIIRTVKSIFSIGLKGALLVFKLNLTYRYDNHREKIVGYNPARLINARFPIDAHF